MRNKMVQSDNFSQYSKIADECDVRQQSKWCVPGASALSMEIEILTRTR